MIKENIHIAVVEDEAHIAYLLKMNLKIEGYDVKVLQTGREALSWIQLRRVDLVILDVMLPDIKGTEVCRKIKHIRPTIPVLMLSALGQSSDRIIGLKAGADDYLGKPFNLEELLLRIDKLLKRHDRYMNNVPTGDLPIGRAVINLQNRTLKLDDKVQSLTSKEVELLRFMIERRNQVLSRQEILENVWGFEVYPQTRTIDNFISTLRKYVGDDPLKPRYFRTIRGIGYQLSLPDSNSSITSRP